MRVALDGRPAAGELTGVGNYIVRLAKGLRDRDVDVTLLYDREPSSTPTGVKKVILRQKSRFLWEQWPLFKYLKVEQPDIYHATWNYGIPLFYGGKSVLTVHDLIPLAWHRYFLSKKITSAPEYLVSTLVSTIKASAILAVSNSTRRDLEKFFPFTGKKTKVVYSGLDQPPNLNLNTFKKKPYFVYFGGIDKRKNIDGLIQAFAKSAAKENHDLVIAGRGSNYYQVYAESFGVGNRVKFVNYLLEEEKYSLIKNAVALVYPSFYEGFGFPPLEAMSVGTPVITSNVSSLPEIVGEAAIKINPANIRQITQAMDKLAKDKALRDNLKKKGFEQVRKFIWDKTVAKTIEVYEEVLKG